MIKDKELLRKVLYIGVPIALQNLISSSINFADVFMIGKLGEASLAAVGLSNQITFLLNLLLFGITSGAGVMTAQYWGKRDVYHIKKVLGLAMFLSIACAILFFLGAFFIPEKLLKIYTNDPEVIKLGINYLKTISLSYFIYAISFVYVLQLRALTITKVTVYSALASLVVNVFLNYVLIYGKFGFKAYGVVGAGAAMVIARIFEFAVIIIAVYYKKYPLAARFKELIGFNGEFIKRYFKISLPVILNESIWALGINCYSMIYARMSTEAVATVNVVSSIERIVFVGFIGLANASGVIIGNTIGEGNEEKAKSYGYAFEKMALMLGVTLAIVMGLITLPILNIYELKKETFEMAKITLFILCFILPLKSINCTTIVGILRGGGDTKYALYIDVAALWLISVPLAYIGGIIFKLPVYLVFLLASSEEIIKLLFGLKRVFSNKWINNVVK